jgi:precorrin-4/cobalt-precorrin-4 C11-methyltransferase
MDRKEAVMQTNLKTFICLCLALVCAGGAASAGIDQGGRGKFYIVGMGTAPDLITIRGADVIRSADIVLIGSEQEREMWKESIKNKEVWYCPDWIRVLYGVDPQTIKDPQRRALSEKGIKARQELADKIRSAVEKGKIVVSLQGGDPMMYGLTLLLEMLPKDISTEIVPGIGAFQAASAAVKMSPPYGYDTNGVILTMADWAGRKDVNEKLMAAGSTMVFYTMLLDYQRVFSQLQRYYPADTPVAVVSDAGDREKQQVIRSTVGRFLKEVDYRNLPAERHILLIGKFLKVGQARKDFVPQIERGHTK